MQVLATWIVDYDGIFTKLYCCRNNWWFIENELGILLVLHETEARKIIDDSKFAK